MQRVCGVPQTLDFGLVVQEALFPLAHGFGATRSKGQEVPERALPTIGRVSGKVHNCPAFVHPSDGCCYTANYSDAIGVSISWSPR
ncbi:unnamed protein product [Caenorhabditis auriculariae]|uniref:Uncharacterized protein n=1 Tax=Caenorhabditis auriculariae TaxID=2777116 RepID=A0A8S1HFC9_9PELO|nr:unnamed protein product [Caenorhabditis auriculariae]